MSIQENVEKNIGLLIMLVIVVISVGGLVQILPLFFQTSTTLPVEGLKPYSALQLAGRDIYIREGCVSCHSQMVRPFRAETERYGHYSTAGEFIYDRPFLWGSKRTGPDLHRVGGRYSDDWHIAHLINPRDVVPESIMPGYPWLADNDLDSSEIRQRMEGLRYLGHPYTDNEINHAEETLDGKTEMDAVVAYLQSLGTALKDI
ncbi:MAG: cytochrome-c oxidase, cbb3-type subunit II [Gammaproteobacteria bacterium]|nr:cytochrome-c oxidase, cbb3-type subunit II [Gammaproteobacteria bacterium]